MATAYVEVPPEWGPKQLILVALEKLGYRCEELRLMGRGEIWLLLS